jgi:hypothetical protein
MPVPRNQGHAPAELWLQMLTGGPQHVLRNVERDDPASGQRVEQFRGQAAGVAAGVEQQFVTAPVRRASTFFPQVS